MHVVAEAQRNGGICAYIDAEHAMDPVYAKAIGVNIDDLLISQPDTGEQALEIADMLIRSGALDVLVIDSVAALTPRAEIEGEMGDSHVGLQARLMSQALRKLTGDAQPSRAPSPSSSTSCARRSASCSARPRSPRAAGRSSSTPRSASTSAGSRPIKDGADEVGNRTRVKVVKNKCVAAVQAGGVRHHLRPGHQPGGLAPRCRASSSGSSRSPVPGSPTRASSSAKAART